MRTFAHASEPAAVHRATPAPPAVRIGARGDAFEREAGRLAGELTRAPAPEAGAPPLRVTQRGSGGAALRGGGEPLPERSRAFFEGRLGHDFGRVRVHHDRGASAAARAVGARAFALGSDLVFGAGEYAPETERGRRLLAHELVHVAQDGGGATLRRAEVEDRESVCAGLTDIAGDVNGWVNGVLAGARASPGTTTFNRFIGAVAHRTGGSGAVSPVEHFIEALPAAKRYLPPNTLAGTRFASLPAAGLSIPSVAGMNIYGLQGGPLGHVVGAAAKINGFCVGADKLGHFFQQGAQYFVRRADPSGGDPESFGRATEIDVAGLGVTGVYSNADLAANRAGMRFYQELQADPNGLAFDVARYVARDWNEYANPNFYEASVAREVWATQLTGRWTGSMGLGPALRATVFDLAAITGGAVSGTFEYRGHVGARPVPGTIRGRIAYNTTAVSGRIASAVLHGSAGTHSATPVSGITIEFDWTAGTAAGRGVLYSQGEHQLTGTFGNGTSRDDQGKVALVRA